MPIDVTENYIRVRVRMAGDFQESSFRTITISKEKGIKAVIGKPKGKNTTDTQAYLFDKEKDWDVKKARKWVTDKGEKIMSKRVITVLDKSLFNADSIKETILLEQSGVSVLVGKLKYNDDIKVQAFCFTDDWTDDKLVMDFIDKHSGNIAMSVALPDEAASIWIKAYDKAAFEGKTPKESESIAWKEVRSLFYEQDGKWIKLNADWTKELLATVTLAAAKIEDNNHAIEIFKTGDYPQGNFNIDHIDQMIKNFNAGLFDPPVTNDHVQHGAALGWVKSLFRKGESLWAVLRDLNSEFIKKLKAGEYKNRSIEFFTDYIDGQGKAHGALLTAVTFLGANPPQIMDMEHPDFQNHGALLAFSIDDENMRKFRIEPSNSMKGEKYLELTKEQLAEKIKAAVDSNTEQLMAKFTADNAKLADENKKLQDKITAENNARLENEAKVMFDSYAEKGKLLPVQEKIYLKLFKEALGKEDESDLKELKDSIDALPDVVKFNEELTKKKENENPLTDKILMSAASDEDKEIMRKVIADLDARKVKYSIDSRGVILTEPREEYGRSLAAVNGEVSE